VTRREYVYSKYGHKFFRYSRPKVDAEFSLFLKAPSGMNGRLVHMYYEQVNIRGHRKRKYNIDPPGSFTIF